ncbi:hypothetical protein ACWEVD_00725 [Nocardia thailandica]
MDIRLTGTPDELREACVRLGEVFAVREISEPYANRGVSRLARVYVSVDLDRSGDDAATVVTSTRVRERPQVEAPALPGTARPAQRRR